MSSQENLSLIRNMDRKIQNQFNETKRKVDLHNQSTETGNEHLSEIETAVKSIDTKVSTEAQQVLQLDQQTVTATNTSSIDTNTGIVSGAVVAGKMRVSVADDEIGLAKETTLTSIDTKLTVGSDDELASALQTVTYARKDMTPAGLRALKCADDGTLHSYDTGLNMKITKGEDATITGGTGGIQQVLLYGRDQTTDLHPIRITPQGDIDVEIAEYPKGQETMANSFPVVLASDQSNVNTKLIAEDNSAIDRNIRCDGNGKLIVQVDGVRSNGSETFTIPDATTGTSSPILMGTHTRIAFYGDTDNTTNTNIFIEYSQDGTNWYRGAGDNAKIIIVGSTGNFYDEEHITPPRVRLSRPNTSGSIENFTLYYTLL
tara:strand:+ start:15784 stop:16905 length:1122 start_codon:yes stop_codon:yes gene_type:complete